VRLLAAPFCRPPVLGKPLGRGRDLFQSIPFLNRNDRRYIATACPAQVFKLLAFDQRPGEPGFESARTPFDSAQCTTRQNPYNCRMNFVSQPCKRHRAALAAVGPLAFRAKHGSRSASAGIMIAVACLHSAIAHGDSINEKRLRAWYCFGSINYMMSSIKPLQCEGLPGKIKLECDQSKQQSKLISEAQRQRLLTYLMATENAGNSGDMLAAAQGKTDAEQCFTQMKDPQVLSCSMACVRSATSHSSPDDLTRATSAAIDICRDQCDPVCKQPVSCGTCNPW
jgi:hypothetical protein